jgi:5'-nucleotidase/UDP-sugar diphosphatase
LSRARSAGAAGRLPWLAFAGALLLASCASVPPETAGVVETPESHIVIFHCNDVHGKIDNFAKVAAILEAERKTDADVFFFSAGDNFTGDPVIDRYDPPGEPILEIFGRLKLDLMTLGNHEFDYGIERVRAVTSRFPVVSANIEAGPGMLPGLRPFIVLTTKEGIKILVFGLIQIEPGSGLPSTHPDKVKGLRFSEPLAKARELERLFPAAQVRIALTHIGYDLDVALAKEMPELDLIIGGHSHTRVDPAETPGASEVNGVLLAQAGADNRFLGRIDLLVRDGRVVEKKSRLIDLNQPLEEDAQIKALIADFRRNPVLQRVIARAPFEITGKDALGCLATDAMRYAHGLDIAFQNNGGIRLNRLPEAITLKDAYTLDPFGNQTVEIVMTPDEIRGLIKTSFEKKNVIDLQVSGISYVVRSDNSNRIREIVLRNPDGSPLAEDRTYRVGMSSYVASSYGFIHKDPGRSLQTNTVDDLIKYLESGPDLSVYRDVRRAFAERAPEPAGR